jgi:hypothetical protein
MSVNRRKKRSEKSRNHETKLLIERVSKECEPHFFASDPNRFCSNGGAVEPSEWWKSSEAAVGAERQKSVADSGTLFGSADTCCHSRFRSSSVGCKCDVTARSGQKPEDVGLIGVSVGSDSVRLAGRVRSNVSKGTTDLGLADSTSAVAARFVCFAALTSRS